MAPMEDLKSKRKGLRARCTRAINRLKENIDKDTISLLRLERLDALAADFRQACDINTDMISLVEEDSTDADAFVHWEAELIEVYYNFIDEAAAHQSKLAKARPPSPTASTSGPASGAAVITSPPAGLVPVSLPPVTAVITSPPAGLVPVSPPSGTTAAAATTAPPGLFSASLPTVPATLPPGLSPVMTAAGPLSLSSTPSIGVPLASPSSIRSGVRLSAGVALDPEPTFDRWIDELVEFQERVLPGGVSGELTIASALYRIEAGRDIPTLKIKSFSGKAIDYVDFIDSFKLHIHEKPHLKDDARLAQLRMHLSGDAERLIAGLGCAGVMYATALKQLKDQFGARSVVARAFIDRIARGKKIDNSRDALRDFSIDVINVIAGLQRLQYFADVNAVATLRRIVQRLPDYLIDKWQDTAAHIRERDPIRAPSITDFLRKKVRAKCDPDFGDLRSTDKGVAGSKYEKQGTGSRSFAAQAVKYKCYICSEPHKVPECPTFVSNSVSERHNLVKTHNLCFSCLVRGHRSKDCRSKRKCGKAGCTRWHHVMLHVDSPPPIVQSAPFSGSATAAIDKNGILPVVRVLFRAENGRIRQGNVLVDSGSTTNIIRRDFARGLGLQGKNEPIEVQVVGGSQQGQQDSRRLKFWISHLDGGEEHLVEAHEMDCTVSEVSPLNMEYLHSFSHLRDLNISHPGGPVDLILGVQYSHLHSEEEVRRGLDFEPIAKRIPLGWYVIGSEGKAPKRLSVNLVRKVDMSDLYDLEVLGVRAPTCQCPVDPMSSEDRKSLALLERSVSLEGDRYMIGLPWKRDPCLLPDNYCLTKKRLISLERSLSRTPEKALLYDATVQEYVDKGWAVRVDPCDLEKRPRFYLPHHGIYRPDKLSTPLRVVFDPACQFQGVSLNSFLYKGPNLIGNLFGVLLRFREDLVAIVGDISKMFLQILLKPEDTEVHRFLWRNRDDTRDPEIFKLTRVAFGDRSSPDMASLVMLKIAERHKTSHPEAAQVLEEDRYVDDLIHSCGKTDVARGKMSDLDEILATGSFRVKEWYISRGIGKPEGQPASVHSGESISLGGSGNDSVKTLGVSWDHSTDFIHFKVKDPPDSSLTKRSVLSHLSTLFDPLGLATPVTITAKIAMQDIWRLKDFGWDTGLPPDQVQRWNEIFSSFKQLETVSVPRSVKPDDAFGIPQLHVFGDASIHAYGAVAYMLWPTADGISVRLFSSKARVAPLHQTTIPRLELVTFSANVGFQNYVSLKLSYT
ncbi:uncharacterized protein LOC135487695 [Lineus longissimus]|uniref:uncharacterized protein LOC135487695 n=1 Tax=Lineus longissimus TaxID=88925 RepID=UPI00315C70D0